MEVIIKIPKEFEEHFKKDRFEDSLARVASDIESFGFQLAGRYEQETITMLRTVLKNSILLPKGHGNLKDVDALYDDLIFPNEKFRNTFKNILDDAPTIIPAERENEE